MTVNKYTSFIFHFTLITLNQHTQTFDKNSSFHTPTHKCSDREVCLGGRKAHHVIHTGSSAISEAHRFVRWICCLILIPVTECHSAEACACDNPLTLKHAKSTYTQITV